MFLLTIGVLLGFSVFAAILHNGGFVQGQLAGLIQMFVVIAVFRVLLSNKYLAWASVLLFMFGLFLVAVGTFTTPEQPRLANEIADFITAVFRYVSGHGQYNPVYEQTFVWILASFIGLFTVLFVYQRPNFMVMFLVFAAVFGVLVSIYFFAYFFLFYLFIFCSLMCLCKALAGQSFFFRFALPLVLACVILAGFIPIPQDGVHQTAQTDFIASLRRVGSGPNFATRFHYFGIQQTGFGGGDSRRLGGNISTNDATFMRVRTDSIRPIYLTGSMLDAYTGYSWENQFSEERRLPDVIARYEEYTIWIYHLVLHDEAFITDEYARDRWFEFGFGFSANEFRPEQTIRIGGLNRDIHTIFHRGFVQGFDAHPATFTRLQEQSGQLVTREIMPAGTWYTLTYHPTSSMFTGGLEADEFGTQMRRHARRGLLREVSALFESQLIPTLSFLDHGGVYATLQQILDNDLIPRADWIYETYTALPDAFPARVRELAQNITAEAQSDYDKARLLETYLRTQFTYSLTPGMPPPERDFVDYFLFDSQVGYCTYFATAFVTMARSLGVPARYVEGFLVTGDPDPDGYIHVLNSMGHAWGEVYLEGYGWLQFEPTPGVTDPTPAQEDVPAMGTPTDEVSETDQLHDPHAMTPGGVAGPVTASQGRFWAVPLLLGGLLIVALLGRVLQVWFRVKNVGKLDNRESVCYHVSMLLKYLELFRFKMEKTETILQFYQRVTDALGPSSELRPAPETIEIYARARYGDMPVSREERLYVTREVERIDVFTRSRVGKWKYWAYRYVLGVL